MNENNLRRLAASILLSVYLCAAIASSGRADVLDDMGIKLVNVSGETFQMGDTFGGSQKKALAHDVTLSDFSISATEITFAQFDRFCDATGAEKPGDEGWGRGDRPVMNITWNDAVDFCEWLSSESNREIRLPTEAEWEYAARSGGKDIRFGNGKDVADPSQINFDGSKEHEKTYSRAGESRQETTPTASFAPNDLGLYDMSGNVWEWCGDWLGKDYYQNSPEKDPKGPQTGTFRVIRGGSWGFKAMRCFDRASYIPESNVEHGSQIGFRVVATQ